MYTGVLNAFQRIDYLLRAFAVVLTEQPNALLLVLSPLFSEPHEKECKRLADELCISDAITWIAPHSLDDLLGYLALAGVIVISRPDCPVHPVKLLNYIQGDHHTPEGSRAGGETRSERTHDRPCQFSTGGRYA
jgi:hypothetical protein